MAHPADPSTRTQKKGWGSAANLQVRLGAHLTLLPAVPMYMEVRYQRRFRGQRVITALSVAIWLGLPAAFALIGVRRGDTGLVIVGLIFGAFSIAMVSRSLWVARSLADEVVVSDRDIAAHLFVGGSRAFDWDDITEIREYRILGTGLIRRVHVTTGDGMRIVLAPNRIPEIDPRFDELLRVVRERATNATVARRRVVP